MKKNNWILIGAVAIGVYLIYNKMKKNSNPTGRELAPPPVSGKPKPIVTETENTITEETAEGL